MILGPAWSLIQALMSPATLKKKQKNLSSFGFGLRPARQPHGRDRAAWLSISVHLV